MAAAIPEPNYTLDSVTSIVGASPRQVFASHQSAHSPESHVQTKTQLRLRAPSWRITPSCLRNTKVRTLDCSMSGQ